MDIISQMEQQYDHLTPSAKKIADYLRNHWRKAPELSISELANLCGVGEATIFRFCKQVGLSGYHDFRLMLAKSSVSKKEEQAYTAYGKVAQDDTILELCQKLYSANQNALEQTLNLIRTQEIEVAGKWLLDANRVLCCGQGGGMCTAMEAFSRFSNVSPKFSIAQDLHAQITLASLLSDADVVLYCSYSGSTRDAQSILEPAKKAGAKVILITHFPNSPTAYLADLVLLCGGSETLLQSGSIAARMAMLFVVDILVNEFCRRDAKSTIRNKDITSQALISRHL